MSLEMVAFRLYAPYLGYSVHVWGTMIAIVLAAISSGYFLGGMAAPHANPRFLYAVLVGCGTYLCLIASTIHPILRLTATGGEIAGTTGATLIVFVPPVMALACVGPLLVRLLADHYSPGSAAGAVLAVSTVGSVVGVLGTTFYLVPTVGTTTSLALLAGLTLVTGLLGMLADGARWAWLLTPIPLIPLLQGASKPANVLWEVESTYNLVRVTRLGDKRVLSLNRPRSVHTIVAEGGGPTGSYYDEFALGALLVDEPKALVLGAGGGATIQALWSVRPEFSIDAVEIDPLVIEAGHRFLGLPTKDDRLRVHIADARLWLVQNTTTFPLVQLDVYQGGPYVPFYLTTREFFDLLASRMTSDGWLMMNAFDAGKERKVLLSLLATMRPTFPTLFVLTRGGINHLVLASQGKISLDSVRGRLSRASGSTASLARAAARDLREVEPSANDRILTDDHAPIEELIHAMLDEIPARIRP